MEYCTDISKVECGWIGPKGQVYGLEHYSGSALDHERLADEIVRNGEVKHDKDNIYSCVECGGWIKFSPELIIAEAKPSEITQIQKDKVVEWLYSGFNDYVPRAYDNLPFIALGFKHNAFKDNYFTPYQIKNMDLIQFALHVTNN